MDILEIFGSRVFDDKAMKKHLPKAVYQSLQKTKQLGATLDPAIADDVANAMKDWAIEQGATHYTHWFQPMNNFTAGKHDSFLCIDDNGTAIMDFSSNALVKGESDASSFPSGGLRATFEARGYTAWDPTSPAFVRDGSLYIPTAFCSYTGEALDTKTPLLRSMQALSYEGVRLLRLLGNNTSTAIIPTVGAEQEYFLVDRKLYESRLDLKICGRTLIGAKPSKGQELDDHYCGRIKIRISAFMKDLDNRLWSLGVSSKTKHNEAAPAQYELAPIFSTANIACDHNQLTMEVLRQTAKEHGFACLLHEKPFDGVNGSGKHNNYALSTDDGINLLKPGKNPENNQLFQITLAAFVSAVDRHADLLRMSAACPGNDRRLGACEAPPSIISVFLGGQLTKMLTDIAAGADPDVAENSMLKTGIAVINDLHKDESDRNRTSPFAFTGNKFEFRMLGSSQSIASSNVVLNTIIAQAFSEFSDRLEKADDRTQEVKNIIADVMKDHSRIIFNGNNYSQEWVEEAQRRGLPISCTSIEAYKALDAEENIELFSKFGVLSSIECHARCEILLENYSKIINIEAKTMLEMMNREIIPACVEICGDIAESYNNMNTAGVENRRIKAQLEQMSSLTTELMERTDTLTQLMDELNKEMTVCEQAEYFNHKVTKAMLSVRAICDKIETISPCKTWPIPTYTDL
ncbi:MAG: glutamine synthetase III, partial [Oscillospiraceae bacterium]